MFILPACSNLSANCIGTPPLQGRLTVKEIKLVNSIEPRAFSCVFTTAKSQIARPTRACYLSIQLG